MSIALLQQQQSRQKPQSSFGPLRFLEALPWLVLAAAMRVIAFAGGGAITLLATVIASIAVLHAFIVVAQRSIELAAGQTRLGDLDFGEQFRLTSAILWRFGLLMSATAISVAFAGYKSLAPNLMFGLDGMAFDQFTDVGKFWSALIAALVLLTIVHAEQNRGQVAFFAAFNELVQRWRWIGVAIAILGVAYLGLGLGQGLVRSAIWNFWQTSGVSQFIKNLIYFVFIFSFAMLRLWVTLLILTWGLKQSYVRAS